MEQEVTRDPGIPNGFHAAIVGGTAWWIYGWITGIVFFVLTMVVLAAIGWAVVFEKISWRTRGVLRTVVIVALLFGLSISGMQVCQHDGACSWYFW